MHESKVHSNDAHRYRENARRQGHARAQVQAHGAKVVPVLNVDGYQHLPTARESRLHPGQSSGYVAGSTCNDTDIGPGRH